MRTIKTLVSFTFGVIVVVALVGYFFDWNFIAAFNWLWNACMWLFENLVAFFTGSKNFKEIFT